MPKRRANREGNIRKRKDGRWEGRYTVAHDAGGGGLHVVARDLLHERGHFRRVNVQPLYRAVEPVPRQRVGGVGSGAQITGRAADGAAQFSSVKSPLRTASSCAVISVSARS